MDGLARLSGCAQIKLAGHNTSNGIMLNSQISFFIFFQKVLFSFSQYGKSKGNHTNPTDKQYGNYSHLTSRVTTLIKGFY